MAESLGNALSVYMVADESASMTPPVVDELNAGLTLPHQALPQEPMAALGRSTPGGWIG